MTKSLITRLAVCATTVAGCLAPSFVSAQTTDLCVYYLLTPTASAKKDQLVKFYPFNLGTTPIESFEAKVYKNNELLFTEQVNTHVEPDAYGEVTLGTPVHFEYGEESVVSMRLTLEGDENASNDSTSLKVEMPVAMDYPFTWTDENCQENFHTGGFPGIDWNFDEYFGAYYMSGRSTNWMGTLTTDALVFPEGEPVKCSFEFGTSGGDVTLYFRKDYGDDLIETDTVFVGHSTEDFTPMFYTYKAKGPALVSISASLGGPWNASGSIYVRNICFSQAGLDFAAEEILSPAGNSCVTGNGAVSVKARFKNPSPADVVNPILCYDAGCGVVKETYEGAVAAGQTIDYTFAQTYEYSLECSKELKVWCEVEGDTNAENDLVEKEIAYYAPLTFPVEDTFDDNNELWTVIDNNRDGQTFQFYEMANGDMAASYSNYMASEIDESLISPAIRIPAGKHRVAFHSACYNQKGDVNLKLYMSKRMDDIFDHEVLFDRDLTSINWSTGYSLIDIAEEGIYYFVFRAVGSQDAVVIDNFRVDDEDDLGLTDVHFGTITGYNLSTTTVTLSYANYGIHPQSNVELAYTTTGDVYVEETNPAVVNPGDTVTYTFTTLADLSQIGTTYQLLGQILNPCGEDVMNDELMGQPVTNLQAYGVPYFEDFQDESRTAHWLLEGNIQSYYSGWNPTFGTGAYSGLGLLKHDNWEGVQADSWAYSEGIFMERGTYEISYFHHEADYFSGDDYLQSFEVKLGTERSPEGMSILLDDKHDVDIFEGPYEKVNKRVEIPADGIYFLGFHNYSLPNYGYTMIDDVRIEAVKEGLALPYESDFAGADSLNWTIYDLNPYFASQWSNVEGAYTVVRTENDLWYQPEGMVVSPCLHVAAGRKVRLTVDYELASADDELSLNLYAGQENNQATMELVATFPQNETRQSLVLDAADKERDLYIGFCSNARADELYESTYELAVSSVQFSYDGEDGIQQVGSDAQTSCEVRDLSGRLIGHDTSALEGSKGIYVVRPAQGGSARKVLTR